MAIKQPKGFKSTPVYFPMHAGTPMKTIISHTLGATHVVNGNFFELAVLPHFCKLTSVKIQTSGITYGGTVVPTVRSGLISGIARDTTDTTRALGTEILTGGAINSVIDIPIERLNGIAAIDSDRGIGLNFDIDITAGTISLLAEYIA